MVKDGEVCIGGVPPGRDFYDRTSPLTDVVKMFSRLLDLCLSSYKDTQIHAKGVGRHIWVPPKVYS